MANLTAVTNFQIGHWRENPTVAQDTSDTATIIKVSAPYLDDAGAVIAGNFVMNAESLSSGFIERIYVPAGAVSADGLTLGTIGDPLIRGLKPLNWDPSAADADFAEKLPAGSPVSISVDPIWINMILQYALGNISGGLKLNARPTFESTGILANRVFASTGARDAALTAPAAGDKCRVTGLGSQEYDGTTWQTLASSTPSIISWKQPVVAATTAAITLATDVEDGDTLDDVPLATGDRILVKDQAASEENGIYAVSAVGAPTRVADMDLPAEVNGAAVIVSGGTANDDTIWLCTVVDPIIDTDPILFKQFNIEPFASESEAIAGTRTDVVMNPAVTKAAIEHQRKQKQVVVATTANITIATALNTGDTIDGVVLADGDRVLVKSQTAAAENGIYIAGATPARAEDHDADLEIRGNFVFVQLGTANAAKIFKNTNTSAITVGATDITYSNLITAVQKLIVATADVVLNNTTTETSILSETVPANTMGIDNAIRVKIDLSAIAISANPGRSLNVRTKYGGVTVSTTALWNNLSVGGAATLEIMFMANGTTSSQKIVTRGLTTNNNVSSQTTSAETTATDKTFEVTLTWSDTSPTLTVSNALAEIIS